MRRKDGENFYGYDHAGNRKCYQKTAITPVLCCENEKGYFTVDAGDAPHQLEHAGMEDIHTMFVTHKHIDPAGCDLDDARTRG